MRYYMSIFLVLFVFQCMAQENVSYVACRMLLGEEENVARVFLDKNGDFYPAFAVIEDEFEKTNFSLREYSNVVLESKKLTDSIWVKIQEEVVSDLVEEINSRIAKEENLYVFIHGFRKPAAPINGDTSAHDDYGFMRERINQATGKENYFLEIYWDGMYLKPEHSLKFIVSLGKMFKKQAKANAENAGLGLRKVISKIEKNDITVITHSLGAEVVTSLLFNAKEKEEEATPHQRINICMAAPAISKKEFKRYYNRSLESSFIEPDNYNLTIIYNEEDFVLSKAYKFLGVKLSFSRRYGNTRLGCNCGNEAYELEEYFEKHFPSSPIQLIHATSFGASHHSLSYFGSEEFMLYLTK
ncbi:MAG: hypothetical protein ACI8QW_000418 [Saprospiraceae bacterium]|jgi:hypothetical protein